MAGPNNTVQPLSDTVKITEGTLIYSLPRTVFTVYAEMERTIEKPGPYARYAADLLGLNDVILSENESWSLQGITVKSHEESDPSEFYVIKCNSPFQANALALKKEGLILDLNPGSFYSSEKGISVNDRDNSDFKSFDLGSDEYFLQQSDTAYRRVTIDSSFIRIPYIVEKKKRLSVDQLAEKAAKRLMEMREGKHMILTGEANVFPQGDAPINEMNRLEKEYTELFSGKTWKETRSYTFQVIPKKEMSGKPVILFQFSELTGPVTGTMKGGIPVTLELIPELKTKDIQIIDKQKVGQVATSFDKLYYRVPDVVNLKINLGPELLFNSRRLVYQFGEVIQLPSNYIIGN
jgi:hypothetical protein